MRALLVCPRSAPGSPALVAALAAASDLVVAVDGGAALCATAGVAPDVAVGDFDSAEPSTIDALRASGVEIVEFPAEKDATDLELAFEVAESRGASDVVVTGAAGGRLDHVLGVLGALAHHRAARPEMVEPDLGCWMLAGDARSELSLAGRGATFSLVALGGPAVVSVRGAKWELDRATLGALSGLGISNVVSAERVDIAVHDGVVVVVSAGEGGHTPAHARERAR